MLDRFLSDVLQSRLKARLGHLVELDGEGKVEVSVWDGLIRLRNVRIRGDALEELAFNPTTSSDGSRRAATDSPRNSGVPEKESCSDDSACSDGTDDASLKESSSPIRIEYGCIGSFDLNVPWRLLRDAAWGGQEVDGDALSAMTDQGCSIVLSDVHILMTPSGGPADATPFKRQRRRSAGRSGSESDMCNSAGESSDEKRRSADKCKENQLKLAKEKSELCRLQREERVRQLFAERLLHRNLGSVTDENDPGPPKAQTRLTRLKAYFSSMGSTLLTRIISTVSVTVKDVHIRYEDTGESLGFGSIASSNIVLHSPQSRRIRQPDVPQNKHQQKFPHWRPFALGMRLGQFTIRTDGGHAVVARTALTEAEKEVATKAKGEQLPTDSEKRDSTFDGDDGSQAVCHGLAVAEGLCVYWDSGCELMCSATAKDNPDALDQNGRFCFDDQPDIFHSYIIHPMSPSLSFSLGGLGIIDQSDAVTGINSNSQSNSMGCSKDKPGEQTSFSEVESNCQYSRISLSLPACHTALSRPILEDAAYLRRSIEVWLSARVGGHLPEEMYLRLRRWRPRESALKDPRAWWKYAMKATAALNGQHWNSDNQQQHCEQGKTSIGDDVSSRGQIDKAKRNQRPRHGWLLLSYLVSMRKLYKELYSKVLDSSLNDIERDDAHNQLIRLEDKFNAEEIIAFRTYIASTIGSTTEMKNEPFDFPQSLSRQYRERMHHEMAISMAQHPALNSRTRQTSSNTHLPEHVNTAVRFDSEGDATEPKLQVEIDCEEFSMETVEVSCSFSVRQSFSIWKDNSWQSDVVLRGLHIADMTGTSNHSHRRRVRAQPSLLLGERGSIQSDFQPCQGSENNAGCNKRTKSESESVSISIKRTTRLCANGQGEMVETTWTSTTIHLSPLELVYAPAPLNAISALFSALQTPEIAHDYHRMAGVVTRWRAQAKHRFFRALRERKRRHIELDVDISAPLLLIPERCDSLVSMMLVVDLGRLTFCNTDANKSTAESINHIVQGETGLTPLNSTDSGPSNRRQLSAKGSDAQYNLDLTNVQVLCLSFHGPTARHAVIEPFSLTLAIFTEKGTDGKPGATDTQVSVSAVLPRLVFKLTSSAVRLMTRLQLQWKRDMSTQSDKTMQPLEKSPEQSQPHPNTSITDSLSPKPKSFSSTRKPDSDTSGFLFEFNFSAPMCIVRVDNDIDGRDSEPGQNSTELVVLVIRDISGKLSKSNWYEDGIGPRSHTEFDAGLRSLYAIDLYQRAGVEFSLLVSSNHPASIYRNVLCSAPARDPQDQAYSMVLPPLWISALETDSSQATSGLVRIHRESDSINGFPTGSKLFVEFHELFVEWNPDTIAAVQKAMRLTSEEEDAAKELEGRILSKGRNSSECKSLPSTRSLAQESEPGANLSDDEFFDTVQREEDIEGDEEYLLRWCEAFERMQPQDSPGDDDTSHSTGKHDSVSPTNSQDQCMLPSPPNELIFTLSTLSVRFNKEARNRRLFTASMEGTSFTKISSHEGSKTVASIGNLVLLDPAAEKGETMYGRIIGLDPSASAESASIVTVTFETFPKRGDRIISDMEAEDEWKHIPSNIFGTGEKVQSEIEASISAQTSVLKAAKINGASGHVEGCDSSIRMSFSPMRFVYIHQSWMEMADYFFEGISGNEVWGVTRPTPISQPTQEVAGSQLDGDNNSSTVHSSSSLETQDSGELLPGSDAEGIRFLRFSIEMTSPVFLLPVSCMSPQHIRLNLSDVKFSNEFSGRKEGIQAHGELNQIRMQWYNNCSVLFQGLAIVDWSGRVLSDSSSMSTGSQDMDIRITWPIGPSAPLVMPKWNVQCSIDPLVLSLRKNDYALLQHIIWHNIGEESRHLEEWFEMQTLSASELRRRKENVIVHFGYDKKDAVPTTYCVHVGINDIVLSFSDDPLEDTGIADLGFRNLSWSMKKLSDRVSRQRVSCDTLSLMQTSGNIAWGRFPQLLCAGGVQSNECCGCFCYESVSHPNGDSSRNLEISHASINCVYPAWTFVSEFFKNAPGPELWTRNDVESSMQVGDRWYRIQSSSQRRSSTEQKNSRSETSQQQQQLYQFRCVLVSPTIHLPSTSEVGEQLCRTMTMHLSHMEFLHIRGPADCNVQKSLFVDGIELFTDNGCESGHSREDNSLLHPLSFGAISSQRAQSSDIWIYFDTIRARAAYSDMNMSVDVIVKFLYDLDSHKPEEEYGQQAEGSGPEFDSTLETSLMITSDGFDLLVIDDSLRHFAASQKMIEVSLGTMKLEKIYQPREKVASSAFLLRNILVLDHLQASESMFRVVAEGGRPDHSVCSMAWADYAAMLDGSRSFYLISPSLEQRCGAFLSSGLRSRGKRVRLPPSIAADSSFIDVAYVSSTNSRDQLSVNVEDLSLQWNPSCVISVQRFLGRLKKEIKAKARKVTGEATKPPHETAARKKTAVGVDEGFPYHSGVVNETAGANTNIDSSGLSAGLTLKRLTVSLNKEHQHRKLMTVELTNSSVAFHHEASTGTKLEGSLNNVKAWDPDEQYSILERNRSILRVLQNAHQAETGDCTDFLTFHYRTSPAVTVLPTWIQDVVNAEELECAVDDSLSVSVMAPLELTYIGDRSAEILDYLSNGLPGKGMGATSRAAQGFIHDRIKTRSFLEIRVVSPQVYVPQNRCEGSGVTLRLGDVLIRSWFEEGTLKQNELLGCDASMPKPLPRKFPTSPQQDSRVTPKCPEQTVAEKMDWWRVLSVSVSGIGWSARTEHIEKAPGPHERNERSRKALANAERDVATANPDIGSKGSSPVTLSITVRKPTWYSTTVIVRGQLSAIHSRLKYSEYVLVRRLIAENVGKPVDTSDWDNVEKRFEEHNVSTSAEEEELMPGLSFYSGVAYGASARLVHYGKGTLNSPGDSAPVNEDNAASRTSLDLKIELDSLSLTLHRNDTFNGVDCAPIGDKMQHVGYDMLRFRVSRVVTMITTNSGGGKSLNCSLYRLDVHDLGDPGRLKRKAQKKYGYKGAQGNIHLSSFRAPCAFSVIAEGYGPSRANYGFAADEGHDCFSDPQIVLTVDTVPSPSVGLMESSAKASGSVVTVAKVVVNYLSINALIRPMIEVGEFMSMSWPSGGNVSQTNSSVPSRGTPTPTPELAEEKADKSDGGFVLQLSAHYPRIFLLADESDPCTRALVLRGLAVVNASITKELCTKEEEVRFCGNSECDSRRDLQTVTSIDANFHELESYINPNVSGVLQPLRNAVDTSVIEKESADHGTDEIEESMGVALIEPVTAAIEVCQVQRDLFPTRRSACLSIEPVSTMISFEDVSLVEAVSSRWSLERSYRRNTQSQKDTDEQSLLSLDHSTSELQLQRKVCIDAPPSGRFGYFEETCVDQFVLDDEDNTDQAIIFEKVFDSEVLGLGLRKSGSKIMVDSVQSCNENDPGIIPGDELVASEGKVVSHMPLAAVNQLLGATPRPATLRFRRRDDSPTSGVMNGSERKRTNAPEWFPPRTIALDNTGVINEQGVEDSTHLDATRSVYTLSFRRGKQNGLCLLRFVCADAPVVSYVDEACFFESLVDSEVLPRSMSHIGIPVPSMTKGSEMIDGAPRSSFDDSSCSLQWRAPQPGAVVVAVDNTPISAKGFKGAVEFIHQNQIVNENHTDIADKKSYTITFMEADSSYWSTVDNIDIKIAQAKLTVINDINGRDMPILRACLMGVDLHAHRGLGVKTRCIDVPYPVTVTSCLSMANTEVQRKQPVDVDKQHAQSEIVLSATIAVAETSIEYYNARVAAWEPLLEPQLLEILFERQKGLEKGNLAVMLADGSLDLMRRNINPESSFVCINVTDAAAETLITAALEWKEWRQDSTTRASNETDALDDEHLPAVDKLSTSYADTGVTTANAVSSSVRGHATLRQSSTPRNATAQNAAKAALNFAKKRGAKTQKKDAAKPFLLRNNTGVPILFEKQADHSKRGDHLRGRSALSLLSGQSRVEDGCEARFDMELVDQAPTLEREGIESDSGDHISSKRLKREYEGRFPYLTIALEPLDSCVVVELLHDLNVVKVGESCRRLRVQVLDRNSGSVLRMAFVQVLWRCELLDNRRVLTVASAACITSACCDIPIEIGTKRQHEKPGTGETHSQVTSLGVCTDSPLYIPLWLDLAFEDVCLVVRPLSGTLESLNAEGRTDQLYQWSSKSIAEYSLQQDNTSALNRSEVQASIRETEVWQWKRPESSNDQLCCFPKGSYGLLPVWLSFTCTEEASEPIRTNTGSVGRHNHVTFRVCIGTSLSLRNLLPVPIEWEVTDNFNEAIDASQAVSLLDGSAMRCRQRNAGFVPFPMSHDGTCAIASGGNAEILSCNISSMSIHARIRCDNTNGEWTEWASVNAPDAVGLIETEQQSSGAPQRKGKSLLPTESSSGIRQMNIQAKGAFGVPVTVGVKIIPKPTNGFDVTFFAELWIKNLTPLPLVFGAPHAQMFPNISERSLDESETGEKVAAEAALLEITSVLEFGDKGRGLGGDNDEPVDNDFYILPIQESSVVVEEVFEYIEIEYSMVKRRWWASEMHDRCRSKPSFGLLPYRNGWQWDDNKWMIDCAGQVPSSSGGWESCRNLVGGQGKTFLGRRAFDPFDPFRRRRWFRRRQKVVGEKTASSIEFKAHRDEHTSNDIFVFHQPALDATSRARKEAARNALGGQLDEKESSGFLDVATACADDGSIEVSFKCGDGQWCVPAVIPPSGSAHGVLRVSASRWPHVTRSSADSLGNPIDSQHPVHVAEESEESSNAKFGIGCLSACSYELSYSIKVLSGYWGEFSRILMIESRYFVRNDSLQFLVEVKQIGTPDTTALTIKSGGTIPFYWTDVRFPELMCVRPVQINTDHSTSRFKWSGGFDICSLGMTPLRIRSDSKSSRQLPCSMRANVEIRPGTGGTGITVSFREEESSGKGSLFRIENKTPHPIWYAQDGCLSNPMSASPMPDRQAGTDLGGSNNDQNGDLILPNEEVPFALDVPFRQGKYAHRRAATMRELLRLRVGLAPLFSRDGVESTKVIGLSSVGNTVRLSPSRLLINLGDELTTSLLGVRVLGIVCTDGPTRVLRFCLMEKEVSTSGAIGNVVRLHVSSPSAKPAQSSGIHRIIQDAARKSIRLLEMHRLPSELVARREAFYGEGLFSPHADRDNGETESCQSDVRNSNSKKDFEDTYSISASFRGFLFSIVDSAPSEIAVAFLRDVSVQAKYNSCMAMESAGVVSIGWLQIDNHCPSAIFPVALCPDEKSDDNDNEVTSDTKDEAATDAKPFLSLGMVFAPQHSSGISCLRSVTIKPSNIAIAIDLAFVMRVQRFLLGLQEYFHDSAYGGDSDWDVFPDLVKLFEERAGSTAAGVGSRKLYFEGLTILPCNVSLSVAPARALTPQQASLEGADAAAIHAAVRKGDLLIGDGSGLDVKVGSTNRTALAVIRGVFKSILVDALLKCDGASLDFAGVALRNHFSTGPQLCTYLTAHYLTLLRNNIPALLGSLAFFGNPVGLIRGLGDGVSDFVNEPVKGFKRSVEELDPSFVMDGVARGTGSLARHTVGGIADSASLLTETFSKNMAVLTLDRRYAQRRDRAVQLRAAERGKTTFVEGIESGVLKLLRGVVEGVSGVIRAPIRGAEKRGVQGFAKGVGKGLLGLLVKPVIGLSDAATDVMIGVKGSVERTSGGAEYGVYREQLRPRRALYGRDRSLRQYQLADATAALLMTRTRLAGEEYLSHFDMGSRVALLSVKRFLLLSDEGKELLMVKFKQMKNVEIRQVPKPDGHAEWGVLIFLRSPRKNGSEIEVINCEEEATAIELCTQMKRGMHVVVNDS